MDFCTRKDIIPIFLASLNDCRHYQRIAFEVTVYFNSRFHFNALANKKNKYGEKTLLVQ